MPATLDRAIFSRWPELRAKVRWCELGEFPTRVESLERVVKKLGHSGAELYIKREDVSSPVYGGNKIRTLEALFGQAKAKGARSIVSTGAYGSNHTVATVLHAPRAGLRRA